MLDNVDNKAPILNRKICLGDTEHSDMTISTEEQVTMSTINSTMVIKTKDLMLKTNVKLWNKLYYLITNIKNL